MKTAIRYVRPAFFALALVSASAMADLTDLSTQPISGASSAQIKPNVLFILDDSYSMSWDYLPDWAGIIPYAATVKWFPKPFLRYNARFNGIAYNPEVRYLPPSYFNADGTKNTTKYPEMTSANTTGWTKVPLDAYGVQYDEDDLPANPARKDNLVDKAFYYLTVPGEYCTDKTLRKCNAQSAPSADYPEPAYLRWCRTVTAAAGTTASANTVDANYGAVCQSKYLDATGGVQGNANYTFMYPRMPSPRTSVITNFGSNLTTNPTVTGITVNGKQIMSEPVKREGSYSDSGVTMTLINNIAQKINDCTMAIKGNCTVAGYRADVLGRDSAASMSSNGKLIITAPENPGAGVKPLVQQDSGSLNASYISLFYHASAACAASSAYNASYGDNAHCPVSYLYTYDPKSADTTASGANATLYRNLAPGDVRFIRIAPDITTYPKVATRTDCAGASCTYAEEMTNYANWYAYYRTRMQSMKTATSRAFDPIDDEYRIGYYSINNNTSGDFQNINEFSDKQKNEWYEKLFASSPFPPAGDVADTPLRRALSDAGWLYAGKYDGQTLKINGRSTGVEVVDPMQYYCQPAVTILSTDGYWNKHPGFTLLGQVTAETDCLTTSPGTANCVKDQDGPLQTEPPGNSPIQRPQLDGGVGSRAGGSQQWTMQLTGLDGWYQKRTWEWTFVDDVYKGKTLTQPQKRQATLQEKTLDVAMTDYQLQRMVFSNHETWYRVTKWEVWESPVQKVEQQWWGWTYQEQIRTNTKMQYQLGKLWQVPRVAYTRTETPLRFRYQKVTKTTRTGLGETVEDVQSCTESSNVTCALIDFSDWANWPGPGACEAQAGGVSGGGTGDNQFKTYKAVQECAYNGASTSSEVLSCTPAVSTSSPFSVNPRVTCAQTTPSSTKTEIPFTSGNCMVNDDHTCEYTWTSKMDYLGTEGFACANNYTTNGTEYVNGNPLVTCTYTQTAWTGAPNGVCNAGTENGITTECQKITIVPAALRVGCVKNDVPDADGKTVDCKWQQTVDTILAAGQTCVKTPGSLESVEGTTGIYTDCRDTGWVNKGYSATCASNPMIKDGGTTSPARMCTPVEWEQDPACAKSDVNCTGQGWSLWGGVASCTPTTVDAGSDRWKNPQPGDVRCRYVETNQSTPERCPVQVPGSSIRLTDKATLGNPNDGRNFAAWTPAAANGHYYYCKETWSAWKNSTAAGTWSDIKQYQYSWGSWTNINNTTTDTTCNGFIPALGYPNAGWAPSYMWQCSAYTSSPTATTCASNGSNMGSTFPLNPVMCQRALSTQEADITRDPDGGVLLCPAGTTCTRGTTGALLVTDDDPIFGNIDKGWPSGTDVTKGSVTKISFKVKIGTFEDGTVRYRTYTLDAKTKDYWAYFPDASDVLQETSTVPTIKLTDNPATLKVDERAPYNGPGTKLGGTDGFCKVGINFATSNPLDFRTFEECRTTTVNASSTSYVETCGVDGKGSETIGAAGTLDAIRPQEDRNATWDKKATYFPNVPVNGTRTVCTVVQKNLDANCGKVGSVFNDYIPGSTSNSWLFTWCSGGLGEPTPNTLADVAQYYWKTDLRDPMYNNCQNPDTGAELCTNTATTPRQYMRTFTLGLGASGVMQYQEDYDNDSVVSGDYYSILKGERVDIANGVCTWQTGGTSCNWPKPASNAMTNIDDLWHTAVNGRGKYFSAQNPGQVAASISSALSAIAIKDGSRSEVVVTNPNLAQGDVYGFRASFIAENWVGNLQMFDINPSTGAMGNIAWSASIPTYGNRKVYTFDPQKTDNLKPFDWDELDAAEKALFGADKIKNLSQMCTTGTACVNPAIKADVDLPEKLVAFLAGDRSNEGDINTLDKAFRQRQGLLGDIVYSTPAYVQKPLWLYTDNGYSEFRESQKNRKPRVYVGANDGMLHAFIVKSDSNITPEEVGGRELWAYVPRFIQPEMYWLADKFYANRHRFYVDGSPIAGDICSQDCRPGDPNPVWKTILVGGANLGARGFYALDVTDPDNPKALWEISNKNSDYTNLGYSYGNPIITKLKNGQWVVLLTSGYNNVTNGGGTGTGGSGDGRGHIFVVDANTGSLLLDISNDSGSSTSPSGLVKIAGWSDNVAYNNTVRQIYGGDVNGKLWRFDMVFSDATTPPVLVSGKARLLAELKDPNDNPQPITSTVELALINNKPIVFVGTGRLLGASDLKDNQIQSFYGIKDQLPADTTAANPTGVPYDDIRNDATFIAQTFTQKTCPADHPYCTEGTPIVEGTKNRVDWKQNSGWYVDFPVGGERVNTSTRLLRSVLTIVTNTPQSGSACVASGLSSVYFLDFKTGGYVDNGSEYVGGQLGEQLGTSSTMVQTDNGKIGTEIGLDGTGKGSIENPIPPSLNPAVNMRRISWRELVVE